MMCIRIRKRRECSCPFLAPVEVDFDVSKKTRALGVLGLLVADEFLAVNDLEKLQTISVLILSTIVLIWVEEKAPGTSKVW